MPLAIAFADHINVTGFDLNKEKISLYKSGIDPTNEVGNEKIQKTTIDFTTDEQQLQYASFHIIAVPTPINQDKTPDFGPIIGASTILAPAILRLVLSSFTNQLFIRGLQKISVFQSWKKSLV